MRPSRALTEDGDAAVAEAGLEAKLWAETELDLIQTIGRWTARIPAHDLRLARPLIREIRAPFIPYPWIAARQPPCERVVSDVLGPGECQVVLKELFGLKRRLVPQRIPIWVEPWAARRKIVGYHFVWRIEYVPAEFLKRVVTSNCCCGKIKRRVYTEIVEHPELLNFVSFFGKDCPPMR